MTSSWCEIIVAGSIAPEASGSLVRAARMMRPWNTPVKHDGGVEIAVALS